MRSLEQVSGGEWIWRRRGFFSRTYDLLDPGNPEEPFATLRWREAILVWRSRADLVTPEGTWRFVPEGAFGRTVRVLGADGVAVATFRRSWRRGTLALEDGRTLAWRRPAWLARAWVFEDENGTEWLRVRSRFFSWLGVAELELGSSVPAGVRALLAGFAFYLVRAARARQART